jgi:2-C-methyl-D-erythritol 2,4-cyclodiphosphate synthase
MFRIGHGYDAHRFADNRKLVIGGAVIPYERGLDGHSDADVLSHAIMDALLGAAGLGDIGCHFPPGDSYYKDISSLVLLEKTNQLLAQNNWRIGNIDATVVAQQPKLAPYKTEMVRNITGALGIGAASLNIKFTTEEGMGFTGRGEGMAAHAVCILFNLEGS